MDWIFTGIVVIMAVRCFSRGFVRELLSVAAYVVGLFAGLMFSNSLIDLSAEKLGIAGLPPTMLYVLAFIVCFVLGFLVMKLIARLLHEGLEAAKLDVIDKILGLILGIGEGLIVVSLVLLILDIQEFFDVEKLLSGSLFATTILPIIGPTIQESLRPALERQQEAIKLQDILRKQ
jgi:membrane protein required for colicin V production